MLQTTPTAKKAPAFNSFFTYLFLKKNKRQKLPFELTGAIHEPENRIYDTLEIDTKKIKQRIKKLEKKAMAFANAVLKDELYDLLPSGISPIEEKIRALCSKAGQKCLSKVLYKVKEIAAIKKSLLVNLAKLNKETIKNEFLIWHSEQVEKDHAENQKKAQQITVKEEKLRQVKRKKEYLEITRDHALDKHYSGYAPTKGIIFNKLWYYGVQFLVFSLETVLNFFAIENLPDNELAAPFIALVATGIGLIIWWSCHYLGVSLTKKSNKWEIITPTSVIVILLSIVFYIRFNGASSAFVLILVNKAGCIMAAYWSYLRHKDDRYFIPADEADKLALEEANIKKDIDAILQDQVASKQQIIKHWESEAERAAHAEITNLEKQIERCEKISSHCNDYFETQVALPIYAIYQSAIQLLRANLIAARKKHKLESVSFDDFPVKVLDFHHGIEGVSSDFENIHKNGKTAKSYIYSIFLFLFITSWLSCNQPDPVFKEAVVVSDPSMTIPDTAEVFAQEGIASFLFRNIDFDPKIVTRDAIRIKFTSIGDTYLQPVYTAELKEGDSFFFMVKSKRKIAQKSFEDAVIKEIKALPKPTPKGLPYSYVHSCMCEILVPLINSNAQVKQVLLLSDLILNAPDLGINFYRYKNKDLMSDYDELKRKLDLTCPELNQKGLKGINIAVLHLPEKKEDKITKKTREFWSRFLREKGAHIEFVPNLPRSESGLAIQ